MSDAEMSDEELLAQARRDYAAALAEHERNPQPVHDDLERFIGKVADLAQRVRDRAAHDPVAHIDLCHIADKTERDVDLRLEALNLAQIGRAFLGLPPSPEFLSGLVNRLSPAEPRLRSSSSAW